MVVLLQRQDRLVVLLERQEVNSEAVRHRLLLGVVLEMASHVEKDLGHHFANGFLQWHYIKQAFDKKLFLLFKF